ncbi:hypothetical protein A2198_02585 [Candidatus Peribacteria bacterium RIFOXYA1_FULL_56_14]|nr:MAG: hypothetical protein A2198_02585 [Candidatus Peribacteria bacterium RIFOXYA1_FULL_56_14]
MGSAATPAADSSVKASEEREPGSDDEPIEGESKRVAEPPVDDGGPRLTPQQITILSKRLEGAALTVTDVRAKFGWKSLEEAPAISFNTVSAWIKAPC